MHLNALGLSHHTAPVAVRERLAFPASRIREALQALRRLPGVREAAILSTCNRTEIYTVSDGPDCHALVRHLCQVGGEDVRDHLYTYAADAVPRHLFHVSSGTDSMIVGEAQILGQVREAARFAVEESTSGPILRRLFDCAMACGRRVRNETEIGRGAVSVSHMAVELARQIFGRLDEQTIMLLGAGETAELVARVMVKHGVSFTMVANRTYERAEALAADLGGKAVKFDQFPEYLQKADIVVSSTAAPHAIIRHADVRTAANHRRGRPMFFIDLAVPRDIEPTVGGLDNVFLYNLDDLQTLAERNREGRKTELGAVNRIIDEEVQSYLHWLNRLEITPVLSELQQRLEEIRQAELERTERRLEGLSAAEHEAVEHMTRAMMKKILHAPWQYLKTAPEEDAASTLQALVDAFHLECGDCRANGQSPSSPTAADPNEPVGEAQK